MDVMEAIMGRRSIRQFTDRPIDRGELERLLEAARWAPSGGNQQRWRFVVVTSLSQRELIRKFAPGIFAMPAAFIVVCADKEPDANPWKLALYLADCSIASQNIMLAAHEMGIGTCVALSYAKSAISEILELPENVEPMLVVTLGYPAEAPEPPPRFELSKMAFEQRYGQEWKS
ncbi:MAG: nitroreductase family protein [Anaerolineae bacterium]|nr:nitroreductase family protein [Anaerolineae bacterium]